MISAAHFKMWCWRLVINKNLVRYLANWQTYARRIVFSHVYKDKGTEDDAVIIAGSGRSGTTWLADMVAKVFGFRLIFEPFYHLHLKADGIDDFFHHRYIAADDDRFDKKIRLVVGGRYSNSHANRHFHYGPYYGRVIKDICANLFLHRIKRIYPDIPIIFIVRHPCAVVLSRLKKRQWYGPWGEHAHLFNEQSGYLAKYFNGRIVTPNDELEDHAITYCHENFLPLTELKRLDIFYMTYYEKIMLDKKNELQKIIAYIQRVKGVAPKRKMEEIDEDFSLANPESVDGIKHEKIRHLLAWQKELSGGQIEDIKKIVDHFKLGFIMNDVEGLLSGIHESCPFTSY